MRIENLHILADMGMGLVEMDLYRQVLLWSCSLPGYRSDRNMSIRGRLWSGMWSEPCFQFCR